MPLMNQTGGSPAQDRGSPAQGRGDASVIPKMFGEVSKALFQITQVLKDAGAPPELQEKMADITNQYNEILEAMGGGSPQGSPEGMPRGAEPQGSPNMRPAQ